MADDSHTIEIVESTYEPTPDGQGMVLKTKSQVVQDKWPSPFVYLNYTLEHRDPKKQQAGQRAFAALRRATGVLNPQDSEELHYKAFTWPLGRAA